MTPEQKAKELVDKFEGLQHSTYDGWGGTEFFTIDLAKQCAIICCNEILDLKMINAMGRDLAYSEGEFWEKTKEEIQKL